ncbi:MAG: hypothetical protein K6G03_00860, partial [Lachnospiraceae bacterium]|nr:hypothetical protein [Lachnospiraceae bacterium]
MCYGTESLKRDQRMSIAESVTVSDQLFYSVSDQYIPQMDLKRDVFSMRLTDHGLEKKVAYDLLDDKEKNDYDSRLTSMKDNWNEATAESKTDEA